MALKLSKYEWGYKMLISYIYILLFGSWVLKLGGIPSSIGLPIVAAIDIIPLGIWLLSNPSFRVKTKEVFIDTFKFWILWVVVLILLLFTAIKHGGSPIPAVVHWGALIRYIPLAYIVILLGKHIDISSRIIKHFKIITVILVIIGYLCILVGDKATIFLPLLPESATGERETLNGNYSAVFANTIDYAFILVLFYCIFVYRQGVNIFKALLLTIIFFIPIFKTGSAIATAVFILISFFRLTQKNRPARYSIMTATAIVVAILGYIYWDLVMMVVDNAKLSRLGMLTQTGPDFISEMSFDTLFGVGNDPYVVLEKVNGYKEKVLMLRYSKPGDTSAFGDVYWVAILVYHGLIGLSIITYLYYSLFKATSGKRYIDSKFDYNRIIKWFFFAIFIFAFLNQVVVVKTFALVFWIFLAIVYNKIDRCR